MLTLKSLKQRKIVEILTLSESRVYWNEESANFGDYSGDFVLLSVDLLTSRAFQRVARQYARSAIVRAPRAKRERASERKLVVRAGSYHTRPENNANDFEKVYLIWRPRDTFQNLESPGLSGGVDSTDYFYVSYWRREPPFYVFIQATWRSSRVQCKGSTLILQLL